MTIFCPYCLRADAWSVWQGNNNETMGTCHRAGCSYGSRVLEGAAALPRPPKKEPRYFTRPTERPTAMQAQMFDELYGLPPGTVNRYSREDDRFLLPVESPDWKLRGYVARSMSGALPKTLTYNQRPDEPFVHWSLPPRPDYKIVVVEDWFSAEKVALCEGAIGVSLQGTHLSDAAVAELAAARLPAVLAFDLDAFGKACMYRQRYAERFKAGLKVWRLKRDLKYESVDRIEAALRGEFDDFGEVTNCGTTQG